MKNRNLVNILGAGRKRLSQSDQILDMHNKLFERS